MTEEVRLPKKTAFDKAMDSLARSMRTEKQLRDSLSSAGRGGVHYDESEIEDAIARMKELGYIDDRAYAERYLEILKNKKRGRLVVMEEMRRRGVPVNLAEEIMDGGYTCEEERENAVAVASKAFTEMPEDIDPQKAARKLFARLASRGYGYDIAGSVVSEMFPREE
jgi:regulatory protein